MDGICVGETPDLTVDEGCKILELPMCHDDHHRKRLVRVASPLIPGAFQPTFHHDCSHNQLRAVVGRVIGVVPKPSSLGIARLKAAAARVAGFLPRSSPQDLLAMPNRYTGAKKQRYLDAAMRFVRFGVRTFDAGCTMFVKPERMHGEKKVNPDPRAIQFRSSVYCVALAQHLQPIEHHIYELSGFCAGVPPSRNIAKGLNQAERAELLRRKMAAFRNPRVISLDASRFDKHVDIELLKVEHSVYTTASSHPMFKRLLKMQLISKVRSKYGLKYVCHGRRMSGDMNTACGNCLLMLIMVLAFCIWMGLTSWDTLDDGDDCLLIVEEEDLDRVLSCLTEHFLEYGMEMKVENVACSLHEVIFCQSSVVEYADARFKFVRDYRAVISKSLCGIRHWQDPKYRIKVLRAIGLCELVLNLGVPVLQSFACCLLRNVGRPDDFSYASDGLQSRVARELRALGVPAHAVAPQVINECARESFAIAFNCSRDDQLFFEQSLDALDFDHQTMDYFGVEWDVANWLAHHSSGEVYPLQAKCRN